MVIGLNCLCPLTADFKALVFGTNNHKVKGSGNDHKWQSALL